MQVRNLPVPQTQLGNCQLQHKNSAACSCQLKPLNCASAAVGLSWGGNLSLPCKNATGGDAQLLCCCAPWHWQEG